MERSFIITEESKLLKSFNNYFEMAENQKKFVHNFLTEKGIEGNKFLVSGNGFCNIPFSERHKHEIGLYILPTENDNQKFGKWLKIPHKHHGLCGFKANSEISKEFAQKCVENKIVINLDKPQIRDYLSSLGWHRYAWRFFKHNEKHYLHVRSEYLKKDDLPEGFIEIKLSEFYRVFEEAEKLQESAK